MIVHRVVRYRYASADVPLCWTSSAYLPTQLACTVGEPGRTLVTLVDSVVDCMTCLVEEARRT